MGVKCGEIYYFLYISLLYVPEEQENASTICIFVRVSDRYVSNGDFITVRATQRQIIIRSNESKGVK